jgi:tight adherence protein B
LGIVWILLISLATFGAAVALTLAAPGLMLGRVRSFQGLDEQEHQIQRSLDELFLHGWTARRVTWLTLSATVLVVAGMHYFIGNIVVTLISGTLAFFSPRFILSYLRNRRLEKIEEQLPDAVRQIAHSTKAGLSLTQSLAEATQLLAPPVSQELGVVVREMELGTDLGQALNNARARVPTRGFGLVVTALLINREKGGNLPETMDRIGAALREIWRLEQKLITASSEGRKAVWVISLIPFAIFGMVAIAEPEIPRLLTTTLSGFVIVILSFLFYGGGLWWLLRVLRTDV